MLIYTCSTHGIVDRQVRWKTAGIEFCYCPICYKMLLVHNLEAMQASPYRIKDEVDVDDEDGDEDDSIPF
jgi:hypothetical protein